MPSDLTSPYTYAYTIDATDPFFTTQLFTTTTPPLCECSPAFADYAVSSDGTSVVPIAALSVVEDTSSSPSKIKITATNGVPATYNLYIRATYPTTYYLFTPQITFTVSCGPSSTALTLGSYPSTYTAFQATNVGSANAFFYPEAVSNSVPGCTLDLSGITVTGSALGDGLSVSWDGTAYIVTPVDPAAHYEYSF